MRRRWLIGSAGALVLLIVAFVVWEVGAPVPTAECIPTEVLTYFLEIALGAEYGDDSPIIHKWKTDLAIEVLGDPTAEDRHTLNQVISELNELIGSRKLGLAQEKSNVAIHFVPVARFSAIEPDYVAGNYGFFSVWVRRWNAIYKANILIASDSVISQEERSHLIREELTQTLGLFNDSHNYPDSLFYEPWTDLTEYADIDREIIKLLYRDAVDVGMSREDLLAVLCTSKFAPDTLR